MQVSNLYMMSMSLYQDQVVKRTIPLSRIVASRSLIVQIFYIVQPLQPQNFANYSTSSSQAPYNYYSYDCGFCEKPNQIIL